MSIRWCPCCGFERKFFHKHHILPRSLGGIDAPSNIIELCEDCHGRIHSLRFNETSVMIKAALAERRKKGLLVGRPPRLPDKTLWRLHNEGRSIRELADMYDASPAAVHKAIHREELKQGDRKLNAYISRKE